LTNKNHSEQNKNINQKNSDLDCFASKASNEIMISRLSECEDPEFPFGKSLLNNS
tara:strand:- start:10142 stop:10306 length:165 start_codon:yes stop_codon:yes gene_type:complete